MYLGYILSYQVEVDISNKIAKYTTPMAVINNVLKISCTKTLNYVFRKLWPNQSYAVEVKCGQ